MMKAIILAALAIVVLAVTVTIVFRRDAGARRVGTLLRLFLWHAPVVVLAWAVTPADLGVLPPALLAEPPWLDLAACLFFYTAGFGGGLAQLYNLADRGFSLRILAELGGARGRALTVEEIAERYSGGRGLGWMYGKRLDGLVGQDLVAVEGDDIVLTARGRFWAERFAGLRGFLGLPTP